MNANSSVRPCRRTFHDLIVWRKAHEAVLGILGYGQTKGLMNSLEEVSGLLNAYARAILASCS